MNKKFVTRMDAENLEIKEAEVLSAAYNGVQLVKILGTNYIYYEKVANLADTRDGAIEILQNKLANLQRQLNNVWNQK